MRLPKVTFGRKFPDSRLYDYMVYDQVTGFKIWRSNAVFLDKYTGKGGLLTDKAIANKTYSIDYGLVPYKIPAELPIPNTTTNHPAPAGDSEDAMFFDLGALLGNGFDTIINSDGGYLLVGTNDDG